MSTSMRQRLSGAIAALFATVAVTGGASAQQRIVVPLTEPGRPGRLDVSLLNGSIEIVGYEGNEVVILVDDDDRDDDDDEPRSDGLRRIPNTSLGMTAEERDNTVSVRMDFAPRDVDLSISVPRFTSVRAATVNGGDLKVSGVTGEHELSNVNGDIEAAEISGSAVIGTTNGDVEASFVEVAADRPMSFSSFNGDIDVTFPAALAAELRINTSRGDVLTDFEVELRQEPAVVERGADGRGRQHVRLERGTTAIVGGGGPQIRFSNFNGDVRIRKRRR